MKAYYVRGSRGSQSWGVTESGASQTGQTSVPFVYTGYTQNSSTGVLSVSGSSTTLHYGSGQAGQSFYKKSGNDINRYYWTEMTSTIMSTTISPKDTSTYTIMDYRFIGEQSVYGNSTETNGALYSGYYYRILGPSYDDYTSIPAMLADQMPGTIVYLNEQGVAQEWIVAAHDYPATGKTYLLRRLAAATGTWHSSSVYNYGTSRVDTWLTGTFSGYLDEFIQNSLAQVSVTGGTYSAPETIQRKIFLPSAQELGFSGTYNADAAGGALLPVLDAYASGTYWQRMLVPENGTATTPLDWWTRSLTSTRVAYAAAAGTGSTSTPTGSRGIRPALVLPSYMGVDEYGAVTAATPRPYSANVDGVWRETDAYQNVGGIWKPSTDQKANIEGIWR